MPTESLTLSQARRVALRAQGLDRSRRAPVGAPNLRHLMSVVDRTGLLQIDSVNVLARAHLMPAFSRLGPYDVAPSQGGREPPRRLVEAWAHEASLVPPATWRMLGWQRRSWRDRWWGAQDGFVHTHAAELDVVRAVVRDQGPVTARQVHEQFAASHPRSGSGWWDWTVAKESLERLFFIGEVAVAGRTTAFERR